MTLVNHILRSGQRFRLRLHLRGPLTDHRRVREVLELVRDDTDRECHEGNPMDVPSTVFPKEVPHLPVFLRVLVVIKERDDLVACLFEMIHGDVEDEIVTADVSDKPSRSQTPHDIAQDLGQQPDDAVTVLVSIAIVEFRILIRCLKNQTSGYGPIKQRAYLGRLLNGNDLQFFRRCEIGDERRRA